LERTRLTSPGVLLIVATVLAGAISLLDLFYLQPYVETQKAHSFDEQVFRAGETLDKAMQQKQQGLLQLCRVWADRAETAVLLDASVPAGPEKVAAQGRVFATADADLAWLCDRGGHVVGVWAAGAAPADTPAAATADQIAEVLPDIPTEAHGGRLVLGRQVFLFARCEVAARGGAGLRGQLYLARRLDGRLFAELGGAVGGKNMHLADWDSLPDGATADAGGSHAFWPIREEDDLLPAAWVLRDVAGRKLGYLAAELPGAGTYKLAASARRMVLIVLSLSVGLALLVIIGTHMLVTGPVVRLLKRLQELEDGEGTPADLTHDLHGEPLVLARRLESAFDKLAYISKTDELTGLANRRHFEEMLNCFYQQARRYNRSLSLIVVDVDFFKAVNDTGGHQAGDDLLRTVARSIESACRKADLPARLGGDEFAVLLPETASSHAASVAERIRKAVAEQTLTLRAVEVNVTLSAGITDLNAGEIDTAAAMVELADRALYRAKETGRNRIVQAWQLDGLDWREGAGRSRAGVLYNKLAGLDTRFQGLFLQAMEEVMAILELRDPYMADHAARVQRCSVLLAREMELPERIVKQLEIAAMLHDIGMLAMPDSLLLCPGVLDEQQTRLMRRHPLLSVQMMEGMEFLEQEIPAVRYHHERYDGQGYPEGLAGPAIPLTARLLATADAFVAMTSPRTFRSAKPCAEAVTELEIAAGTQFDPSVVDAFIAMARRLGDKLMDLSDEAAEEAHAAAKAHASTAQAKLDAQRRAAKNAPAFRTPSESEAKETTSD